MRFVHKFMYWCILYINSCPLSFVRICVQTWEQNFDKLKCLLYYSSLKVKWICKDTDMKSLQTIQKRNRQISIYIQQDSMYGEAHFEFLTFDTHRFQIGHFCFNLLLTGIVQPHSVLTWHCFVWTQFCCTLLSLTQFWLSLVEPRLSSAALTSVSLTLG